MKNIFAFAKKINRPLILDGAMGSILQQRGVKRSGPLWMTLTVLNSPGKVRQIHEEYIDAGADIITTNTFRSNPAAVKKAAGFRSDELVKAAVKIAGEAVHNQPVFIAGSNPPAEDSYQLKRTITAKELKYNHHKHVDLLISNGCDFILNETQSHFDEIKIISRFCDRYEIPYVISLFIWKSGNLISGEHISAVLDYLADTECLAVGVNCLLPAEFQKVFRSLNKNQVWGFYLNCGSGIYTDEEIKTGVTPSEYGDYVKLTFSKNPSFIGGCCGSTPAHIRFIKKVIDENHFS